MTRKTAVLVVEDDAEIGELIVRFLKSHEMEADVVANGAAMDRAIAARDYDVLILDLNLPGEDGLAICRRLRAERTTPIIMVTARGDDIDKIIGLEMGADDYLSKPFNPRELVARIRAVLRRGGEEANHSERSRLGSRYEFAGWRMELSTRELTSPSQTKTALTGAEFDLLHVLVRAPQPHSDPGSPSGLASWPDRGTKRAQHRHVDQPICGRSSNSSPAIRNSSRRSAPKGTVHASRGGPMTAFLRRFRPDHMAGQIALLVLAAILIFHFSVVATNEVSDSQWRRPIVDPADVIASAVVAVDAAAPGERQDVLARLAQTAPWLKMTIGTEAPAGWSEDDASAEGRNIAARLGLDPSVREPPAPRIRAELRDRIEERRQPDRKHRRTAPRLTSAVAARVERPRPFIGAHVGAFRDAVLHLRPDPVALAVGRRGVAVGPSGETGRKISRGHGG